MKRKREEIGFHRQKRSKVDVIHPVIGTKEYKSIELRNGLTVLVISDSFIRRRSGSLAAAAMSVRVGSLCDPKEIPGLSHFFEHMVFTGTKQFPLENEFKEFLKKHGGDANGFTDMDYSQFHLEVGPDYFKGALERFSQLFIAPLLNINSMVREIHAIDSEFESYKQEDKYRLEQFKCHTYPTEHPLNRFTCGNKKTLLKDSLTMESLRHHTLKLFNEYYYGAAMKLTVIGQESVSVLESWVREYFNGLKTRSRTRTSPKFKPIEHLRKSYVLYGLQAVEDHHIFEVSWMIPPKSDQLYLEKPENYLIELLGHEVKGSLYALFKDKGWATSLLAKVGDSGCSCTSFGRMFIISIHLTNSGLEKKYEMVSYIYQYLKLLRGMSPAQWVMKEFLQIKKMEFDSLDFHGIATNAQTFAKYLSANMLDFPVRHAVCGEYLHQKWDPKAIEDILKHFTPQSMRLDLVSNSIKAAEFKIEPWFNALYIEEQVPLVFKEEWNNISVVDKALHLPARNKFIPSSFKPIDHSLDDVSTQTLVDDLCIKIYYKCGGGLAHAYFIIYLNGDSADVKIQLMSTLFVKLLEDDISETMFQGSSAGLNTSLSLCHNKVVLKTHGYFEKLGLLISEIVKKFMNFLPTVERFEVIKESMDRELNNNDLLVHSEQLLVQMLQSSHSNRSKLKWLKTISFGDLSNFIPELRSKLFIKGICFGGISKTEAMRICDVFCDVFRRLQISPLSMNLRDIERRVPLPSPKLRADVKVKNKFESNSLAKVYFRIGCENQVPREIAMLNLFVSIISAKFFHQLRTKENLGYVVECGSHLVCGVGLYACVMSSNYSPSRLSRQIYKFMDHLGLWLERWGEKRFEGYKNGVIARLPDDSGKSIWEQIVRESCIIDDFYSEQKNQLSLITKKELIAWYKKHIRRSPRTVAVGIWGCNTDLARAKRLKKKMKVRWCFSKMRHLGKIIKFKF